LADNASKRCLHAEGFVAEFFKKGAFGNKKFPAELQDYK
jgi:hypothetical protein|tara:strand:- start:664 stop:780 length:117 start_codon:yes stop_codon:yes gene_type:complete